MLHSKEDIVSEVSGLLPSTIEGNYKWVIKSMDLWGKQECIRFAEWIKDNYMPYYNESDVSKCWVAIFNMSLVDSKLITSEQLYAEFINEQAK
jgi:hypothetical protein